MLVRGKLFNDIFKLTISVVMSETKFLGLVSLVKLAQLLSHVVYSLLNIEVVNLVVHSISCLHQTNPHV